jgi:hypothetical protein
MISETKIYKFRKQEVAVAAIEVAAVATAAAAEQRTKNKEQRLINKGDNCTI